jgi:hypothetical protein
MNYTELLEKNKGIITQENFHTLVEITLNEFKSLGFNVNTTSSNYTLEINNKALKRLGRCEAKGGNNYIIQINEFHNKLSPGTSVMNTFIHELLHSLPKCMNHGEIWKRYANKYNTVYGTTISRTSPLDGHYKTFKKEIEKQRGNTQHKNHSVYSDGKHKVTCSKCASSWYYERAGKIVKLAMQNKKLTCPHCGSQPFYYEQLY